MASHLEAIRGVHESFARGDEPGVLAVLSPDVEWTEAEGFPHGGAYSGPDAVPQGLFTRLGTEWDGFSAVPREFVAHGDTVVSPGLCTGTCKRTGKRFSAPFAHVWHRKDGVVVTFHQHTDTAVVQRALR